MVAYERYLRLSQSRKSEERGEAAHLAAMAYVAHRGPADEQAALYAALMGFLDDPSVKVRAALAYGLLHSAHAPRPLMLALAHDAPVISRAVVQFCPVLLDSDLVGIIRAGDPDMLPVMAMRPGLTLRVAQALLALDDRDINVRLLERPDLTFPPETFERLGALWGSDARLRGALLAREDLPASVRVVLIERAREAIAANRIVSGAIQPRRLERLLRDSCDRVTAELGEREAGRKGQGYVAALAAREQINTRLMLHALIHGQVLFFAECLSHLAHTPRTKVFTLLDTGSRAALNALFARCGFAPAVRSLLARMVFHARRADLADDVAARHYVVSVLVAEIIAETGGDIPPALDAAFSYLNEQNIALARAAARGVMPAFAAEVPATTMVPDFAEDPRLALPAA